MSKSYELPTESPWRALSEREAYRVQAVAARLLSNLDYVTDWRLQKIFYLAEVWSIEERLTRLTASDFASWTHGPWSLHVRESVEALEARRIVVREFRPARRRAEADFIGIRRNAKVPSVAKEDAEFLDSFTQQIKFLGGDALTQISKSTRPYATAKRWQLIGLDRYLEILLKKHQRFVASPKVAKLVAEAIAE